MRLDRNAPIVTPICARNSIGFRFVLARCRDVHAHAKSPPNSDEICEMLLAGINRDGFRPATPQRSNSKLTAIATNGDNEKRQVERKSETQKEQADRNQNKTRGRREEARFQQLPP